MELDLVRLTSIGSTSVFVFVPAQKPTSLPAHQKMRGGADAKKILFHEQTLVTNQYIEGCAFA
jgi:hypothetical protein